MKEVRQSAPTLTGMLPYDPKYKKSNTLLSANESPCNIPDEVMDAILARVRDLDFNRYPDPLATQLRVEIAQWHGVKPANVLVGNGGDELLFDIFLAWGGPERALLTFPPTFSVYETNAVLTNTQVYNMPRNPEDWGIDVDKACERLSKGDIDIVILTNPNNPTGTLTPLDEIRRILDASDALVLVDEAYGEYAGQSAAKLFDEYENLLILHTFSKAYRCAGVRLGYFLGSDKVINEYKKVRQPYSVDALSQIVGEEVVRRRELFEPSIEQARTQRDMMIAALEQMEGVTVYPSEANFVMIKLLYASRMWKNLDERYSVLVRNVSGETRLADCLRVSVGSPEENERFLEALRTELDDLTKKR